MSSKITAGGIFIEDSTGDDIFFYVIWGYQLTLRLANSSLDSFESL
jgi:hypothetical protein